MYNIPKTFKVADHEYKVTIKDFVYDSRDESVYGTHCDVTCEIEIARKIRMGNTDYELTDIQMLNSFFHELFHCFQFYYDNGGSEAQAQSFANMMTSYALTKQDGEDFGYAGTTCNRHCEEEDNN